MSLDFDVICRVCLERKPANCDIFTSYDSNWNVLYSQMLAICTNLNLYKGDSLPTLICMSCVQELKRAYKFNIRCMESDQTLLAIVKTKQNDEEIKKEDKNVALNLFDVKDEPGLLDDLWQAEDDNTMLASLKPSKSELNGDEDNLKSEDDLNVDDEPQEIITDEVKKKRGRPRKGSLILTISSKESKKRRRSTKELNGDVVDIKSEDDLNDDANKTENKTKVKRKQGRPRNELSGLQQCDVCGKFLSNSCNLKQHQASHTSHRPYHCADCPATFKGYSALFQHKKIHSGETPYHCHFCPKQFSRRTTLVYHIKTHTGEKGYECEVCYKSFAQSTQLSTHMKRHNGDKSFLCQVCGKGFPVKADLKVHERVHNGEKPYVCQICPKTFATAGNLSIHVRIHRKDVRYHCKECQRGFVTCSSYNLHRKRHLGQKDYVCECGKAFYTSSGLKQHRVVHTGEKKYQCKACKRNFSQASHVTRHYKKEHNKTNHSLSAPTYLVVQNGDTTVGA